MAVDLRAFKGVANQVAMVLSWGLSPNLFTLMHWAMSKDTEVSDDDLSRLQSYYDQAAAIMANPPNQHVPLAALPPMPTA